MKQEAQTEGQVWAWSSKGDGPKALGGVPQWELCPRLLGFHACSASKNPQLPQQSTTTNTGTGTCRHAPPWAASTEAHKESIHVYRIQQKTNPTPRRHTQPSAQSQHSITLVQPWYTLLEVG
jgi:hypothetical protein